MRSGGGTTGAAHKVDEIRSTDGQVNTYRLVGVPVPDEEAGEEDEDEERGSAMSNEPVWESVVVTSPTGEAWKVYPELPGHKHQFPMNRKYTEGWDLPRLDNRNNHSNGSISGVDGVLQGEGIVEVVIGQVCGRK